MDATENKIAAQTPPSTATPAPRPKAQLVARLFTTIALWAVVLLTVFKLPPFCFYLLLTFGAGVALWEFYTILEKSGQASFKYLGLFFGCALIATGWYFNRRPEWSRALYFEELLLLLFVLCVFLRQLPQRGNPQPIAAMANTLFGILYVPWLLNFMSKLTYLESPDVAGTGDGRFFVLYLILLTKFSDVGAYVFGSLFGRHKLIPRISPNKTWEGALGAILVPLGLSLLMYWAQWEWLERLHFTLPHAIILGVLLGFVAMIGDLVESLIKRQGHVKDSGGLLPGIGGALDLLDSLLFTAPVFYVYLRLMLGIPEVAP